MSTVSTALRPAVQTSRQVAKPATGKSSSASPARHSLPPILGALSLSIAVVSAASFLARADAQSSGANGGMSAANVSAKFAVSENGEVPVRAWLAIGSVAFTVVAFCITRFGGYCLDLCCGKEKPETGSTRVVPRAPESAVSYRSPSAARHHNAAAQPAT
jgi:hypothetical protein